MKTCNVCHTPKPVSDFYAHKSMADGHLNKCKECTKARVKANRTANAERYRAYDRGRASLPHRIASREKYQKSDAGRVAGNRAKRAFVERYPGKRLAHVAVRRELKKGGLIRLPCEICRHDVTEAHHDDYTKPLAVRWLCKKHHVEWHKQNKPVYAEVRDSAEVHSQQERPRARNGKGESRCVRRKATSRQILAGGNKALSPHTIQ